MRLRATASTAARSLARAAFAWWVLSVCPVAAAPPTPVEAETTAGAPATNGASPAPNPVPSQPLAASEPAKPYLDLIGEGLRRYESGNFVEARALFERAHAREPSARTLRALGVTAYELRHYAQAVAELRASLEDTRKPLSPAMRDGVLETLARAEQNVGSLELRTVPSHARVSIGALDVHERVVSLDVGDYDVTARAEGFRDATQRVRVASGERRTVELQLARIDVAPASAAVPSSAPPPVRNVPAPTSDTSLLESPWLWAAAAVVLAGGVTSVVLLAGDDAERVRPGDVGGVVQVLTLAR